MSVSKTKLTSPNGKVTKKYQKQYEQGHDSLAGEPLRD